jgi:hypothetical protein
MSSLPTHSRCATTLAASNICNHGGCRYHPACCLIPRLPAVLTARHCSALQAFPIVFNHLSPMKMMSALLGAKAARSILDSRGDSLRLGVQVCSTVPLCLCVNHACAPVHTFSDCTPLSVTAACGGWCR